MPELARHLSLSPQVCVCVLSYQRLDLLRTTLRSIVGHLETVERGLPYELVWVDNGSNETERDELRREFAFEKALLLGTNYGMAYGFNTLFFRLCSAPYFLTLEEDWEWLGDGNGVGQTALADAISVLRHDAGLSGVFLRPDTFDQFLRRGPWRRAPRARNLTAVGAADRQQSTVVDARGSSSSSGDDAGPAVEYATYCMDRAASYLWGAYSNGPGLYDRNRLMGLVGRQFGEPTDSFPDPASESNYAYRVGAAGLCSAVMRVWPGCEGVHECNMPLFRHLGDERSHGYGKGRRADLRWLVYGSNHSYDEAMVQLRALDVEPTRHWLSLYLTGGEQTAALDAGDGKIAMLLADASPSLAQVRTMATSAWAASHAPKQIELLWLAASEHRAACASLARELSSAPPLQEGVGGKGDSGGSGGVTLRCLEAAVRPSHDGPASLAERFAALAEATDAELLVLCPRVITDFGASGGGGIGHGGEGRAEGEDGADAAAAMVDGYYWDREVRATFAGDGDVRSYPKDRVLMLQARPPPDPPPPSSSSSSSAAASSASASSSSPASKPPPAISSHAIVHRDALEHLGYFGPPRVGASWLVFSLYMQQLFGSVGRHRWLGRGHARQVHFHEAAAAGGEGAEAASVAAGSGGGGGAGSLRLAYERTVGSRFIDVHRLDSLLLLLKAKSRTSFERATGAYQHFLELFSGGRIAEAWPVLGELIWALELVERSEDWELRAAVGPSMLAAAHDLQAKLLDQMDGSSR